MLKLRTNECIDMHITKLSAAVDKLREFTRCAFELLRTGCEIEKIEPGTAADLR
jgi:hypothetical protein